MERHRGVATSLVVGVLAVCTLLAGACSSDDAAPDTTPATSSSPAATETSESSLPPTTSTSAAPSTSTIVATVAPTTSAAPTTVPAPPAGEAARAAVDHAIADFTACLLALPACDPATLAATRADPMLSVNTERVNEWNAAGYAVADRDQFRYVIESVELSADQRQATVTVCFADGSKLVQPGAAPDGSDLIVDGDFTSGREAWDVRLDDDGMWRAHDTSVVGELEATDVCPAA